jgi:hypothetical protein
MRLELSTFRANAGAALTGGLMSQWRVGAIVEAIAARDASDGQLWLNIGTTRVPARIASGDAQGPANGERLQLRVLRDSPVVALETISTDDTETQTINDALRRFLPRQGSPAPLLANLAWLIGKNEQQAAPFSKPLTDALQKVWQTLPEGKDLQTADGLAKAVKFSGNFLESNLASADPQDARRVLAQDLKGALLALKQTFIRNGVHLRSSESTPPGPLPTLRGPLLPLDTAMANLQSMAATTQQLGELNSQVDAALARINTVQLVNSEALTQTPAWLLEVPFRHDGQTETLRFRFERNSQAESTEQSWTIEAAMNLGEAGSLHARVTLYGKRIGVQLRAEPPQLVAALNEQAPLLTSMLSGAGLEVDRVVCLHGMPSDDRNVRPTSLLDIRV